MWAPLVWHTSLAIVAHCLSCPKAHGLLVPQPGIELASPAFERQILNHWTTREVPGKWSLNHWTPEKSPSILVLSFFLNQKGACYNFFFLSSTFWRSLHNKNKQRIKIYTLLYIKSLGRKDPLEEEMATHSSILAWKIPWIEEPGRLQSTGSQRVGQDWVTEHKHTHI